MRTRASSARCAFKGASVTALYNNSLQNLIPSRSLPPAAMVIREKISLTKNARRCFCITVATTAAMSYRRYLSQTTASTTEKEKKVNATIGGLSDVTCAVKSNILDFFVLGWERARKRKHPLGSGASGKNF